MAGNIPIPKIEHPRGEDGYKTFSIRIREDIAADLDKIAKQSGRTRNDLIAFILEYAARHFDIVQ
jgi:predicted DNA-binding protein